MTSVTYLSGAPKYLGSISIKVSVKQIEIGTETRTDRIETYKELAIGAASP
jgi:enolase